MIFWHSCGSGKAHWFNEETAVAEVGDQPPDEGVRVSAIDKINIDKVPFVFVLFEQQEGVASMREYRYATPFGYRDRYYKACVGWKRDEFHVANLYNDTCEFVTRGDYYISGKLDWRSGRLTKSWTELEMDVSVWDMSAMVRGKKAADYLKARRDWCPLAYERAGVNSNNGHFVCKVWGKMGEAREFDEGMVRRYRRSALL